MIGKYKNGNYNVILLNDGTKIRHSKFDSFEPERPESMDICISTYCRMDCPFCYEGCSTQGKHADVMNAKFIDTLQPYTEIALNGNEPPHPDLIPFLVKCKKLKLIPSLTINQYTFEKDFDLLKKLTDDKMIYGLGVSLERVTNNFIELAKQIPNLVIHVVAGIIKVSDLYKLSDNNLKILILGYKDMGRGKQFKKNNRKFVDKNINIIKDALPIIIKNNWFQVVSFDNLAIEQLDTKSLMSENEWNKFYMGDDGTYTFYVDLVNEQFASSSISTKRYDLMDNVVDMFNIIYNEK